MTDQQSLGRTVADLIGRRGEGVFWDFKLRHHKNKWELVHDVLCLANAEHDGPRFLVFGVKEGDWSVQSIEQDSGRRTQADVATLFRDNARKFFQSRFPRWGAIRGLDPTTDRCDQYELFLRNLLDFDDWRRARGSDVAGQA